MSLKDNVISGIAWNACSRVVNIGLQFVITIILARLLSPSDFGLIAMMVVFMGFAAVLSDPGFAAALIQKGEIEDRHVSSVFWLNIMIGAMLMGTLIALGNFITGFYHEPRLAAIVPLVSSVFFINAFKSVHVALLTRALAFRRLAVMDTLTTLVAGAVVIVLALRGHGGWSPALQGGASPLL